MIEHPVTTEEIWELLSQKLRLFILKRVSDEQVADDLLQETFLRIHLKLGDIKSTERLTAWVFQIARNLVIDHYRSQGRRPDLVADDIEYQRDIQEKENINELVSGWLPAMIESLPETYREALALYELQGVPQQEIADRLGISLSAAKSRVQRGREKLKAILLNCCTFEQDIFGNVLEYDVNDPNERRHCDRC